MINEVTFITSLTAEAVVETVFAKRKIAINVTALNNIPYHVTVKLNVLWIVT